MPIHTKEWSKWQASENAGNSYHIVVSRGYDYEGNRLKAAQKTVHPPKELTPGQCKKWLNEQAVLFEREVRHDLQPVNHAMTLAAYTDCEMAIAFFLLCGILCFLLYRNYRISTRKNAYHYWQI